MKGIIQNFSELSDSKEILYSKPNGVCVYSIYITIALLIVALIWSYLGEIDVVVKAKGIVNPAEGIHTITTKISGKIINKPKKNGDFVKSGQVILEIDDKPYQVELKAIEKSLAKANRNLDLTKKFIFGIKTRENPFNEVTENDYFKDYSNYKMEAFKIQDNIKILKNKIVRTDELIKGYNDIVTSISVNKDVFKVDNSYHLKYLNYIYKLDDLVREEKNNSKLIQRYNRLHELGAVSEKEYSDINNKYLQAKNTLAQYKNNKMLEFEEQVQQSEQELFGYKMELSKLTPEQNGTYDYSFFDNEKMIELDNNVKKYQDEILNLNKNRETVILKIDSCKLVSNIDGNISMDKIYTEGDVISSNLSYAYVIPSESKNYIISLYIPNQSIGDIKVGNKVKLKLEALPYKEYGMVEGELIQINANATMDSLQGVSYYIAQARVVNKPIISYKGVKSYIKVGMNLEGHIITNQKKILYYLLEKIDLWS